MPLPDAYRWSDSPDGSSHLYWNYGFVAGISPDGATKIKLWDKREIHSKAASVAQAKRFIERWIIAQGSKRAYECRRWRSRYFRLARPPLVPKDHGVGLLYANCATHRKEGLSSRTIKVDCLPDDPDAIADVAQSLQRFVR